MAGVKITCLGGGGFYFSGVLGDLAVTPGLDGSEVWLYDIDMDRATIMSEHGNRLMKEGGAAIGVHAATSSTEALDGADFVLSSIGGTGGEGRGFQGSDIHKQDLLIPSEYGIYQIVGDTGGPAGLMSALRSIPLHLEYCQEMEKLCPDAVFLNHSNPMAVLCRALNKYTSLQNVVGICHGVQNGIRYLGEILDVPPIELDTTWVGTNHYYWFLKIRHKKKDVYPEVKKRMATREPPEGRVMTAKLSEIYGYQVTYPKDDHAIAFYPFLAQVRDPSEIPYQLGESSHGPAIMKLYTGTGGEESDEEPSREQILKSFVEKLEKVSVPDAPRSPVAGEALTSLVSAIANERREVYIVNIPNRGSVPNLPAHAVLEVEGVTDSYGLRGLYTGEAPLVLAGMLQRRIAWQELVADAAVRGDRNLALQALMLDEMAIIPEKAEAMLDRLLEASRDYLPQFFPRS